jgi:hypothetical protein
MNRKQKIVIAVGITVFVIMTVYPPIFAHSSQYEYNDRIFYAFLSEMPKDHDSWRYTVFFPRLALQWLVLAVATVGFVWAFHDRKP